MSLLTIWLASQEEKKKSTRMTIQIIFAVLLALAVFLSVKDMGLLTHTTTKIWVLLLAVSFPELYIILHGISTSSMGVSFFTGSPVESKMGGDWYKPSGKSMWGKGGRGPGASDMPMTMSDPPDMGMETPATTVTDTSSSSLF